MPSCVLREKTPRALYVGLMISTESTELLHTYATIIRTFQQNRDQLIPKAAATSRLPEFDYANRDRNVLLVLLAGGMAALNWNRLPLAPHVLTRFPL